MSMALMPNEQAGKLLIEMLEHLADRPIKTAESFRNAVLTGSFAINPMFFFSAMQEVNPLRQLLIDTVTEGRMIDFGYIPNEVIKAESLRSRQMFEAGELEHPYKVWLGIARWEEGMNGYLFINMSTAPIETMVLELYGVAMPQLRDAILLYDMIGIEVDPESKATRVNPAKVRVPETQAAMEARGANSLDPMVTMLRLLADASIPVIDHPKPVKLNKIRSKAGKHPIPAHAQVMTRDYISTFKSSMATTRAAGKGGHHASPIAHWRRAHHRHLSGGRIIPVRSSKVNWRSSEELKRLFYRIVKGTD